MAQSSSSGKGPLGSPPHQLPHYYHPGKGGDKQDGDKQNLDKQLLEGFDQEKVHRLHLASDTDSSTRSSHHTLGPGRNQAAPGDHSHRLIGIWLYRSSDGLHNSSGNYQALAFTDYKFWDQEYYSKVSSSEVKVLKRHIATITCRTSFEGNGTGRRGISYFSNGVQQQRQELPTLGGGATQTQVQDHAFGIDLNVDEVIQIQTFQNSTVNLAIKAGFFITHMKIIRTHPLKIDSAGLASGTIVPQIPGPEIASRKFLLNGSW